MLNRHSLPLITLSVLIAMLASCKKQEEPKTPEPAPQTTGISADPAHEAHVDMITHEFNVGDTRLSMSANGTAEPNAEIHLLINHVSGPVPEIIRIWFGPRSGEGAMKTKASGHDDHWHGHVVCPGTITSQDSLWFEVQYANSEKDSTAIKLK